MSTVDERQSADEKRLAELGYSQELERSWSGFQNFAISFTIISILAGCFTTYGQAFNNGGPIAISWGWPIISIFILIIGFCMSELVSAYPTAGGIYWWAAKMGGPAWGWFTGWFNLIGLVAVCASVDYGAATFLNTLFGLYDFDLFKGASDPSPFARGTFVLFLLILALHAAINILGSHLVARVNSISVWWHVAGVAVIIGLLIFVPSEHASFDYVFTERINNSGFGGGMYWFYVLPLGFLLTQYTITGFDSCAHISEETQGASDAAAKGVWRSIFYSALIGWFLLLAFTFAVSNEGEVLEGGGSAIAVFESAMGTGAAVKLILFISSIGQLFCGAACLTSASRMTYAFSRDGAIPGWRIWSKVNHRRMPVNAVFFMVFFAALLTVPTLFPNADGVPIAFYAVVSVAVIGLYIAYVIPIYLRWREGDKFEVGPWNNGKKYKWMNPLATVWVVIITIIFILPTVPAGVPFSDDFSWQSVNYAPLVTFGVFAAVGIWWLVSAKRTFTGPKQTVSQLDKEIDLDA